MVLLISSEVTANAVILFSLFLKIIIIIIIIV